MCLRKGTISKTHVSEMGDGGLKPPRHKAPEGKEPFHHDGHDDHDGKVFYKNCRNP